MTTTIVQRALELVPDRGVIGLGSGRAAQAFVRALGERIRQEKIGVRGVPTSEETAALARQLGIPLTTLADVGELDLTVDGADEVAPNLDLIKGYGRAMVREKIVAASSHRLVILVGEEKLVPQLGTRGKLPVEVVPMALSLCRRKIKELGYDSTPWAQDGQLQLTDNGNHILDCAVLPLTNPAALEAEICSIPGVVGTGFFLGMADVVLVGGGPNWDLCEERRRK